MNLRGQERTEFPKRVKAAAFRRCCDANGTPHCETCGVELKAGNIIYEHDKADGLGGEPTLGNCKVHCRTCADVKTVSHDNPRMQKADRALKKNYGIRARSSFACSKTSPWRKKINGQVERR